MYGINYDYSRHTILGAHPHNKFDPIQCEDIEYYADYHGVPVTAYYMAETEPYWLFTFV